MDGDWAQLADQLLSSSLSASGEYGPALVQIAKIIWINVLLSGDNAVVIALACRALPRRQRFWGIVLGAGAAVALRIIFTVGMQSVLHLPYLQFAGGLLLLWIAVKLLAGEGGSETDVASSDTLWGAIRTVAIADIVMSLDNVLAIAAAARGSLWLIVFGLAFSIPLIVLGATMIMALLSRYPILVWAGAGLLGWIAGELLMQDPFSATFLEAVSGQLGLTRDSLEYVVPGLGALAVVAIGWAWMRVARRQACRREQASANDRAAE